MGDAVVSPLHAAWRAALAMRERYEVRSYADALFVFDRHVGRVMGEGYPLAYPTARGAARRFCDRLNREWQEANDGRIDHPSA